jgi:hypothetical protein
LAHACNPSYSGGRDQEDHGSKPAGANSSTRPYLEKPTTKIGLVEWLKVKAPVLQKKKKIREGKHKGKHGRAQVESGGGKSLLLFSG